MLLAGVISLGARLPDLWCALPRALPSPTGPFEPSMTSLLSQQ